MLLRKHVELFVKSLSILSERIQGCPLQHDMILDNQTGSSYRSDNNNALQSLATISSGTSAPSTTYAYMLWADTTNNVLK